MSGISRAPSGSVSRASAKSKKRSSSPTWKTLCGVQVAVVQRHRQAQGRDPVGPLGDERDAVPRAPPPGRPEGPSGRRPGGRRARPPRRSTYAGASAGAIVVMPAALSRSTAGATSRWRWAPAASTAPQVSRSSPPTVSAKTGPWSGVSRSPRSGSDRRHRHDPCDGASSERTGTSVASNAWSVAVLLRVVGRRPMSRPASTPSPRPQLGGVRGTARGPTSATTQSRELGRELLALPALRVGRQALRQVGVHGFRRPFAASRAFARPPGSPARCWCGTSRGSPDRSRCGFAIVPGCPAGGSPGW